MDSSGIAEFADSILNVPLFTIAGTGVTATTLLVLLFVVAAGFWLARLVAAGSARALRARGVTDVGTVAAVRRIAQYLILLVVLAIGLQTIGINLNALFAAGAFFAIAAGFAMQNVAQNFVAGLILLADRTIRIGDVLEVEGRVVIVTSMGMRATVARTRDEEDLIIPNSILVQNTVTNFTLRDRNYRIKAAIGVTYGSDLERVLQVLDEAARSLDWKLADYDPRILLVGFGDSSVDFEVHVWIGDPWVARRRTSQLYLAVWNALRAHGIVIAFPQLDVHFDRPVDDALRNLAVARS
jgi:small-conductance mechanosensitive channel